VENDFPIPYDGIIGMDFLKEYKAILNYNDNTISLNFDLNGPQTMQIPLKDLDEGFLTVPPRSEVFRVCHIRAKFNDPVIFNQEITDGVHVASAILNPKTPLIKILNTNSHPVTFKTNKLKFDELNNFDVVDMSSMSRDEKILKIIRKNNDHIIDPKLKFKFEKIITENTNIFALEDEPLTTNNFYKQKLRVTDNVPVYTRNFRTPFALKDELNNQVKDLIKNNVIEPSISEYSSPIFLVPKKPLPGTTAKRYRLVVDFRLLNKKLIGDVYPIPNLEATLDQLGKAKYFSVVDCQAGFHQIELEESSRDFTSFNTELGSFRFKRVPFGLRVAPNSFQRMMSLAFASLPPQSAFLYMDDLIIIGKNENHHLQNIQAVFDNCKKYNIKLNPKKCSFFKSEVAFLGHLCTAEGIKIDPEKTKYIDSYPIPKNADEVKRFVAFANFYRKFIAGFASLTHPLNKLTRKKVPFDWTPLCQRTFEELKNKLKNPPILQYPDFTKPFIIHTDASKIGCGASLSQQYGTDELPVSYFSKNFSKGESNKTTIEQELLAIYFAIKHFRPYIYGTRFIVRSDHRPLVHLFSLKDPSSRLTRIRLELEEYDFQVEHIKGAENSVADALSRISLESLKEIKESARILRIQTRSMTNNQTNNDNQIIKEPKSNLEPKIIISEPSMSYSQTPCLKFIINNGNVKPLILTKNKKYVKQFAEDVSDSCPLNSPLIKDGNFLEKFLSRLEIIADKHEVMAIKILSSDKIFDFMDKTKFIQIAGKHLKKLKIIIISGPKEKINREQRCELIKKFHDDPLTGSHTGTKRTCVKLNAHGYVWKGMSKDIAKHIKNCEMCIKNKKLKNTIEPLILTETPMKPFQIVQIDTVGPLPITENGNKYILTAQCELTSFVIIIPLENKEAKTIAKAIVERIILTFGPMNVLKSDMGTEYLNSIIKEICNLFKITHRTSTAYRPQTIGKCERSHRELNTYLRHYADLDLNDWDQWLAPYQFAYNTTPSSIHQYTPYELLFSQNPNLPEDFLNGKLTPIYNHEDYATMTKYRLQIALDRARKLIQENKERRKKDYDKTLNIIDLELYDEVYITNEARSKLEPYYKGPYVVTEILENNNIIVEDPKTNKKFKIHKNRIKK
jgi:hypothetical protein